MMLFVRERLERFDSFFVDEKQFPWFDLPHKLGLNEVEGAGLGGNNGCPLKLTEDQGPEAKRVPDCDHFLFCQNEQRISPFNLFEGMNRPFHRSFFFGTGDEVNDHLGIHVRLEDGSLGFEFALDEKGIAQVSVVGNGQASLVIIHDKRLSIFEFARTCSGVSDMTDSAFSGEFLQYIVGEYFGDQSHLAIMMEVSAIRGGNTGTLLAAMLKRIKTQISMIRSFKMVINTKNAAHFSSPNLL
jgi:hypothetical protein